MNLSEFKTEIPIIFEKVKNNVREVLGRHRSGLAIGLVDMGMKQGGFTGGIHYHPGTNIVINRNPLRIKLESQTYDIVWSYTYHILISAQVR